MIGKNSIHRETQLKALVNVIFDSNIPLVVYSGYIDLLHLFKAAEDRFDIYPNEFKHLLDNPIYDTKEIGMSMSIVSGNLSLDRFVQVLCNVQPAMQKLHDASYDALLTAVLYEELVARDNFLVKVLEGQLFKYNRRVKKRGEFYG